MIDVRGRVKEGGGNASRKFQRGNVMGVVAQVLGVSPVPGTLNVEIDKDYATLAIEEYDVCMDAREYNGRECVKLKRCEVNGFPCVIIRPDDHFRRSKFQRRIEVMSSVKLRDYFGLRDGDEVVLQFEL